MSWLRKVSSVTFSLDQSEHIAQPKTIYDLANGLYTWAEKNVPREYFASHGRKIDIDGLDTSAPTGTINWYISNPDLAADVPMYVSQWIQEEMLPWGFEVRIGELEPSRMFPDELVYRIHVQNNPTQNLTKIQEMNITNKNAESLFMLLNISTKYLEGSMDLQELKRRIQGVDESRISEFTRDAENVDDLGPFNTFVQHREFGLDADRLKSYLARLNEMVDYGLANGFSKIKWI